MKLIGKQFQIPHRLLGKTLLQQNLNTFAELINARAVIVLLIYAYIKFNELPGNISGI